MLVTTYLYDDPERPERVTGAVTTPEWTEDDRAALLGLQAYEDTLCGGCHQPKDVAWHADANGFYEGHQWICQACTAIKGSEAVVNTLKQTPTPVQIAKFTPFDYLTSTEAPTEKEP